MGAGVALAKLLTPGRDAILIDDTLLFDPDDNRFRMRVVNRLPAPLYSISVDVRLRHRRQVGDRTYFRRRSVKPLVETLSSLPSRRPYTVSTATIADGEAPIRLDTPSVGQAMTLFPEHIGAGVSVHVAMTAQYFAGNGVALKEFAADSIACGRFQRTYRSDEPVDWDKWGRVIETDPSRCPACTHRDACGLRARLSAPNGETAPNAPGAGRPDAALSAPSDRGR